ncbi:NADH-quinone oxidoreductase subunit L [Acaryochloris thomasi RCC1774]|uniref:NADH-quinone oxidoreductase subunit L n=1 Tax=Acaryochloris thomasi RCC1774 TaxID=1764569 RepID=A0A2W1JJL3_9CYAN|nr:NAD(P)H-quinone oxidoreductase subunit F [Acaryochloris thomasi]PZD73426.1 NADH-quinone oxidoreductase subunit L [Acaryochloris thomasi RCC1774]
MSQLLLQTSWLIPIYCFIGSALSIPWASGLVKRTGPRPAAYVNLLMTLLAFAHGTLAFQASLHFADVTLKFPWLQVADIDFTFWIHLSSTTLGVMELVTGMSLLAQLYALGYMEKDWSVARFFTLMGFFEGALSGLAISDSLLLSYALLEMLTLSTFLIVGFWYAQPLVVTAARDAFLTKRVGDILLLSGMVSLATFSGTLNFPELYEWKETANLSPIVATFLGFCLIAGPIGKCAQFPLNLWLDEAMEGANPASIMRNTVVLSCGAYILIKLQPLVALSPIAQDALIIVGAVTAIGTSMMAIAQIDLKRTLSHSSSAYLGLVFMAVGLKWTNVALLILLTHAIAKGLLFMCVGAIILNTNSQDLRGLGGLWSRMPVTTMSYIIGSLGLIGLFPLGGFWALEEGIAIFEAYEPWYVVVVLFVNVLSAINLIRVFRLVFLGDIQPKTKRTPEVAWAMAVPMVILMVVTLLTPFLMTSLALLPPIANLRLAGIELVASGVVGCLIGALMPLSRSWSRPIQRYRRFLQDFLAYDFYTEKLYEITVVAAVSTLSRIGVWVDRYIVDGLVNFVGVASLFSGESLKYSATGQSQTYALTILMGVGLISGCIIYWFIW